MPLSRATPILIVSSTEGHLSMANSIENGIKEHGFTNSTKYIENSAILPYRLYYRYAPKLHKYAGLLLTSKKAVSFIKQLLKIRYKKITQKLLLAHQPKIVISTNYGLNASFEEFQLEKSIKYLTVICDPRSYNLINIAGDGCINLVFDEIQKQIIFRDFPSAIFAVIGWFVRPEFQPPASVADAKKLVGINPDTFCTLFVAGSEGMQRVQNTIKALAETKMAMTILVACGKNQLLFNAMEKLSNQLTDSPMHIKPFGFTLEIAPYFQAADIIVGKAGPNMIFEAVACHKPFFATTSLEGQELGNLELITELGIGFVETDNEKAAQLLVDIAGDPSKITALEPNIKKLAEYNRGSVKRLVQLLDI